MEYKAYMAFVPHVLLPPHSITQGSIYKISGVQPQLHVRGNFPSIALVAYIMTRRWDIGGESSLRRFNHRGPPYHPHPDRYLPAAQPDGSRHSARGYGLPTHEASQNEHESEQDGKSLTRKRIPVACGRCRKRKIRCSGPRGDSGCLNCKNAGSMETCQFNRVQSEEVPFRDPTSDYTYNPEIGRLVQCRSQPGIYGIQSAYAQNSNITPLTLSSPCRSYSLSDYSWQKCYVPTYNNDYAEDGTDYGLSGNSYGLLGSENGGAYGPHSTTRGWATSIPQAGKVNGVYYDSDSPSQYTNSGVQYHGQQYSIRPAPSTEPNSWSFSGMASSLPIPSPLTSNDRLLPIPASNRPSNANIAQTRSCDNLPFNGNPTKAPSSHTASTNSLAPGSSFVPLPSSGEAYSSSGLQNSIPQQHDIYPASSDNWASGNLHSEPALRSQDSSSDLYYGPSSDGSRKASQGGRSSTNSTLSNGQVYHVPYQQDTAQVSRNPSLDISHIAAHRPSNGSLRAA